MPTSARTVARIERREIVEAGLPSPVERADHGQRERAPAEPEAGARMKAEGHVRVQTLERKRQRAQRRIHREAMYESYRRTLVGTSQ
jgi:hypothetical protein